MTQAKNRTTKPQGWLKPLNDKGYILIKFQLDGKTYKLNPVKKGKFDNVSDYRVAWSVCEKIEWDIRRGEFDTTLEKYKPKVEEIERKLSVEAKPELSLLELWDKYVEYRVPVVKANTIRSYKLVRRIIEKAGEYEPLELRTRILEVTSNSWAKRTLVNLSACHKWGMQHKLVSSNPFDGLAKDLPKLKYENEPQPNPFTQAEKEAILQAFETHKIAGNNYSYYLAFVKFLFLTGCRPSEAIGLQWKHVTSNFSRISFETSIVYLEGKAVRNEGSKNNRKRGFPCNQELSTLLQSIKPENTNPDDLIFPSPTGKPINYNNFSKRAWDKLVDPIKSGSTPYCCRDTFISEQIAKGVPTAVVAKWVDNSVSMIEKHYLGDVALEQLRPL